MKTEDFEAGDQPDDQEWPAAEAPDTPVPSEVLVNGEDRIPDEAGYGYGV